MSKEIMGSEAIRKNQQFLSLLGELEARCHECYRFAKGAGIPEGLDSIQKEDAYREKVRELDQQWAPADDVLSRLEEIGSTQRLSRRAIVRLLGVIRMLESSYIQCTQETSGQQSWSLLTTFAPMQLFPAIVRLHELLEEQKWKMQELRFRFQAGGGEGSARLSDEDEVPSFTMLTEWLLRDAYQGLVQAAVAAAGAEQNWDRVNALSQLLALPLRDIPGKLSAFGIDAEGVEKAVVGIGDDEEQGGQDPCRDVREKLRKWLLGKEWQLNWDMMHAGPSGYSPDEILAAQSDPAVAARKGQLAEELETVRDQLDALGGMSCEQVKKLFAHYNVDAGWDGAEEDEPSELDEQPDVEPAGESGGKPPSLEDIITDLAKLEADGQLPTLEDLLEKSEDMVKALNNDEISEEQWRHFQHRLHQRYRLDAYRSPNRMLQLPSEGQAMAQLMPDGTLSVFEGKQTESEYATYEYWVYPDGTYISRDSMAREDPESGEAFQTVAIVAHPREGKDVVLAKSTYRVGEKAPTLEGLSTGSELPQELGEIKKKHPYGPW